MPSAFARFAIDPSNPSGLLASDGLLYVTFSGHAAKIFKMCPMLERAPPTPASERSIELEALAAVLGRVLKLDDSAQALAMPLWAWDANAKALGRVLDMLLEATDGDEACALEHTPDQMRTWFAARKRALLLAEDADEQAFRLGKPDMLELNTLLVPPAPATAAMPGPPVTPMAAVAPAPSGGGTGSGELVAAGGGTCRGVLSFLPTQPVRQGVARRVGGHACPSNTKQVGTRRRCKQVGHGALGG